MHKSAVTDHAVEKQWGGGESRHRIGKAKVIGTESGTKDGSVRQLRKRRYSIMNRDEGQYFLTYVFDELLGKIPRKKITWKLLVKPQLVLE